MSRMTGFILLLSLCLPADLFGRESGWVPVETFKPDVKSRVAPKTRPQANKQPAASAMEKGATVYDKQPLITETELSDFIVLLPQFRTWARRNHEEAHPIVNAAGKPDFKYSAKSADWLKARGFAPVRFFCIMGRMAAGVVIIEEGNDLPAARPADMPPVDSREVALARRHLGELLTAAACN